MHIPRKRFGQHFLCDQEVIQRIIAALNPKRSEHLIEIGPGQGALTLPILKQVGSLEAIEFDRDLIPELNERCEKMGSLQIYSQDALTFDFASVKKDDRSLRVFGNLPYNISTPLIFHLLNFSSLMSDMLFMLQKEVAERMAAHANEKNYGRLSVMVQYHCAVELLFTISPHAFFPPPQVQSSMVRLLPYHDAQHKAHDYELFALLVKQAFGQRRKTLRNSLKGIIDDDVWASLPIRSDLRPENLSVKDFVELSNAFKPHVVKNNGER